MGSIQPNMGSIQPNSDPYNNFASMGATNNSAYQSKHLHYPDLSPIQPIMADIPSEQPQITANLEDNLPPKNLRCWNQLEAWQKVLIVGIPLLLILGLGIGVGSQFNFQYFGSICIADDDTSCAGTTDYLPTFIELTVRAPWLCRGYYFLSPKY